MNDEIKSEFEIRSTAVDFSFGEILNLHKDHEIVIRPEYQRLFRWSNSQRSRLIESILIGLPIPPIFLIEDDNGILELIDGLQRTSSVLQFLEHEAIGEPDLILEGCEFITDINGKSYNDLPTVQKLKIKRSPIRATIISRSGSSFVKYEMFKRLNTGGSLLTAQEIRNCSSRMVDGGDYFYNLLQNCAQDVNFRNAISRIPETEVEKRGDEELVLRFFALIYSRDGFRGNIEDWLDGFMEDVLFKKIDFNLDMAKSKFEETFSIINEKFGDQAFTRFNTDGRATGRLAPAYFEAVCATVHECMDTISQLLPGAALEKLKEAFQDEEFKAATGPGANTIPKLAKRIEVVTSHFVQ
ncbi:DUF262 domain-containing protein [Labrys neptuniae]|uniref:DUF262 domain-containing protein n=1 Tax=Labrys neptuniae TaxID=376174 RepID=UPI0028915FA5|nr:DUF262 domain-containing protein [Labrys neptuniae]MDT3382544.1 DUF262 domain-containing protein [Labrys neptuniae]